MTVRRVYGADQVGRSVRLTGRVSTSTDTAKGRGRPEPFVGRDSGTDDDQLGPVL